MIPRPVPVTLEIASQLEVFPRFLDASQAGDTVRVEVRFSHPSEAAPIEEALVRHGFTSTKTGWYRKQPSSLPANA